ncbi:hypothetical protein HanIR_Chr17g0865171 [Helianthus annuus]|nr:hypothetical protein HanIR_Chr17g0865171 [Helianthus annuus]
MLGSVCFSPMDGSSNVIELECKDEGGMGVEEVVNLSSLGFGVEKKPKCGDSLAYELEREVKWFGS